MSGTFRPVEVPDLGATLARMAQIDAQRQTLDIQRQAAKQEQGFNATLGELGPALAAGQGPEYSAALGRLFAAGPRGATMALPMLQAERQRAEAAAFWQQPQGGAPAVMPAVAMPPASGSGGFSENGLAVNTRSESGGDPNARPRFADGTPRSSATGPNQFIDGTWLAFAQENPALFQGMSREQILSARSNPQISAQATQWYARRNAGALSQAGVPVNDATLGLAHQFDGPVAARIASAPPNTPIDQIVGPAAMRANPDLAGQTAGQVVQRFAQRYGGGATPAATPVSAPAQAGGVNPAEMALIERALSHPNPQVQQQGRARLEVLRLRQQNNPEQYVPATETIGGRQVQGQRNTRTGQFTPFPGQTAAEGTGPFGNSDRGSAGRYLVNVAPRIEAGQASPEEIENFRAAYAVWTSTTTNPATGAVTPGMPATPGVQRALEMLSRAGPSGAQPGNDASGQPVTENPMAQPPRIERDAAGNARVIHPGQTTPQAMEAARRMEVEVGRVGDAMARFEQVLTQEGGTGVAAFLNNPQSPSAARINTAYQNMVTALRSEAFLNTGVLQPAEMAMLQRNFLDPQSLRGLFASNDTYRAQMGELRNFIQSGLRRARSAAGLPVEAGPAMPAGNDSTTIAGPGGVGVAEPPPQGQRTRIRFDAQGNRIQ